MRGGLFVVALLHVLQAHGGNTSTVPPFFTGIFVNSTKEPNIPTCKESNTCHQFDCNYWVTRGHYLQDTTQYFSCEILENVYGCNCDSCWCSCTADCSGAYCGAYMHWLGDGFCDNGYWGINFNCEEFDFDGGDCLKDEPSNNTCTPTCSSASCDFWTYVGDYSCEELEDLWGCNCDGCACCKEDCSGNWCGQKTHKLNDSHCDDGCNGNCIDFNCAEFDYDQGDCHAPSTSSTTIATMGPLTSDSDDRTALIIGLACVITVLLVIAAACALGIACRRLIWLRRNLLQRAQQNLMHIASETETEDNPPVAGVITEAEMIERQNNTDPSAYAPLESPCLRELSDDTNPTTNSAADAADLAAISTDGASIAAVEPSPESS